MSPSPRSAAARAFVRSLNILLKFVRMYDFGHPRTTAQYEIAWSELRAALGPDDQRLSDIAAWAQPLSPLHWAD